MLCVSVAPTVPKKGNLPNKSRTSKSSKAIVFDLWLYDRKTNRVVLRRKGLLRMKATTIFGSLLLSVALCNPGFGMELLGRLIGLENGNDCGCASCATCQSCYNADRSARVCTPEVPSCGSAVCEKPLHRPAVCKAPCCEAALSTKPCCPPVGCEAGCCNPRYPVREVLCNLRDLFQCKKCCCDCGCGSTCCGEGSHVRAVSGGTAPAPAKMPPTPTTGSTGAGPIT
jgi:hypothetical protein